MIAVLILIVILVLTLLVCYTWDLRKGLVNSEYWNILPKGPEYYGICLPVVLFIILSAEEVGFFRVMLCLFLIIVFVLYIAGQCAVLKEKLPADVYKKVLILYILSPLLSISVLVIIGICLSFIFGLDDMLKRKKK